MRESREDGPFGGGGFPGGGGAGSGGGGGAPQGEEGARAAFDEKGGRLEAFGGEVVVDAPAGSFTEKVTVAVKRAEAGEAAAPGGFVVASPVYEFTVTGSGEGAPVLRRPVTVRVRYDAKKLYGLDPRELGLHRQDEGDRRRWEYAGGAVDAAAGTVTARLRGFSRYAVMAYDRTFRDLRGLWSRGDVEAPPAPTFRDVAPPAWYYRYVEAAARHGLARGDGSRFRPGDAVTRQEMAAMLVRALGLEGGGEAPAGGPPFRDWAVVAGWARGYVALARDLGLVRGRPDGRFAPGAAVTRAEAAERRNPRPRRRAPRPRKG